MGLQVPRAEKHRLARSIVHAATGARRRRVFMYEQPRFQLFHVCRFDVYHLPDIETIADHLAAKGEACAGRADAAFSRSWLRG